MTTGETEGPSNREIFKFFLLSIFLREEIQLIV